MYINPVLFGVLITLFVEMAVVITVIIWCEVKDAAKSKSNKGGKYNG